MDITNNMDIISYFPDPIQAFGSFVYTNLPPLSRILLRFQPVSLTTLQEATLPFRSVYSIAVWALCCLYRPVFTPLLSGIGSYSITTTYNRGPPPPAAACLSQ
jgi:hypothetical protein